MTIPAQYEFERRLRIWQDLIVRNGGRRLVPSLLREKGVYGGAQGIWVDKVRTAEVAPPHGLTVSLLHTGTSYADDLSADSILYHYPSTRRSEGRDQSEIEATKNALRFEVPVFVIASPTPGSSMRDVHLGWVEDWDDRTRIFLVNLSQERPTTHSESGLELENAPFQATNRKSRVRREVPVRVGQQRFKFRVLKRYGACCALCGINLPQLLDAAHIVPDERGGTDDPRNGLVLCALHHRAFDGGLIRIEPETTAVVVARKCHSLSLLNVTRQNLDHLARKPHSDALALRWKLCVQDGDTAEASAIEPVAL